MPGGGMTQEERRIVEFRAWLDEWCAQLPDEPALHWAVRDAHVYLGRLQFLAREVEE